MRARPRLRKTAKWAVVVVCAGLLAACLFSSFWELRWNTGTNAWINIGYGAVGAGRVDAARFDRMNPDTPWRTVPRGWTFKFTGLFLAELWPRYETAPHVTHAWLPLWMPLLLAAVPTVMLWRVDRRARRRARLGHCPACGYDRGSLAAEVPCPECGKAARAS